MPVSRLKATLFFVLFMFLHSNCRILRNQYSKLPEQNTPTRESTIPKDAVKMTPETDAFPNYAFEPVD